MLAEAIDSFGEPAIGTTSTAASAGGTIALTPSCVTTSYASMPLHCHSSVARMELTCVLAEGIGCFGEPAIATTLTAASAGGTIASSNASCPRVFVTGASSAPRSSCPSGALLPDCATMRVAPGAASAEVGAGRGGRASRVTSSVVTPSFAMPLRREMVRKQSAAAGLAGRCSANWGGESRPSPVPILELRIDPTDGCEYTLDDFQQEYGGRSEWDLAGQVRQAPSMPDELELRVDTTDGHAYTLSEFLEEYGNTCEWELAVPVQTMQPLCSAHTRESAKPGLDAQQPGMKQLASRPISQPDATQLSSQQMRIDQADGHPYTFNAFLDEYGGTSEWELAMPVQPMQS